MKITDLLDKRGIELNPKLNSKKEAIDRLVNLMDSTGNLKDKEEYKKAVVAREELSTTGIGRGVAIPHAKTVAVKKAALSAMVIKSGIDYDSLDGKPSKLFFMIAAPEGENNLHMEVLARLCTILMEEEFKNTLINAKDKEEFVKLIEDKENEKIAEENKNEQKCKYRVLAVTACPTGIAHTFMAAESLENKAKEMGISIKVETNGATGAKNVLTKEEIEKAEGIIVAADKKVHMARFDGKRVVQTKVASGIHNAEELIEEAVSGKAPVYRHNANNEEEEAFRGKETVGREMYKHLMNGVSYMLPFAIGGGILLSLAPLLGNYSINQAFLEVLMKIGNGTFGLMLPVLAGYIAMSIGDRAALAVGFAGGLLASFGGSGFLGAALAGFIAGYLVLVLKKLFSKLPSSIEGIKPIFLYPFFGILLTGLIVIFLINPPVACFNNIMANILNSMGVVSKIVLGGILGAMMVIDMGGVINKLAYIFGIASLVNGPSEIMASVMIGGMVPPLVIALSTTFFKNRFTKEERRLGLRNYLMGLAFITEGAIPFAKKDPLSIIPACVIGSAIAGALSMTFGCSLRAPHGGIFILPIITNPLGYLIALVTGSILGMLVPGTTRILSFKRK